MPEKQESLNEISVTLKELADIKSELTEKSDELNCLRRICLDDDSQQIWFDIIIRGDADYADYTEYYKPYENKQLKSNRKQLLEIGENLAEHDQNKPQEKEIISTAKISKRAFIISSAILLFFLIFSISLFVQSSNHKNEFTRVTAQNKIVDDILENTGSAWDEWSALWNIPGITWQELGEEWDKVENDWQARGLHISWEYVTNVKDSILGSTIYYSNFKSRLFSKISDDFKEYEFLLNDGKIENGFAIALLVVAFIALSPYFIVKGMKNARIVSDNNQVALYNSNQLSVDLEKFEKERIEIQNKYNAKADKVFELVKENIKEIAIQLFKLNEEIISIEKTLSQEKFNFNSIRKFNADKLRGIAEIIDDGRADSFKVALNLYLQEEADKKYKAEMWQLQVAQSLAAAQADEEAKYRAREAESQQKKHNEEMLEQEKKQTQSVNCAICSLKDRCMFKGRKTDCKPR
jgi:hypothetical protein